MLAWGGVHHLLLLALLPNVLVVHGAPLRRGPAQRLRCCAVKFCSESDSLTTTAAAAAAAAPEADSLAAAAAAAAANRLHRVRCSNPRILRRDCRWGDDRRPRSHVPTVLVVEQAHDHVKKVLLPLVNTKVALLQEAPYLVHRR